MLPGNPISPVLGCFPAPTKRRLIQPNKEGGKTIERGDSRVCWWRASLLSLIALLQSTLRLSIRHAASAPRLFAETTSRYQDCLLKQLPGPYQGREFFSLPQVPTFAHLPFSNFECLLSKWVRPRKKTALLPGAQHREAHPLSGPSFLVSSFLPVCSVPRRRLPHSNLQPYLPERSAAGARFHKFLLVP